MKQTLVLLALTAFLFSCSSSTPESVAKGFAMSMASGDIDAAKNYVTKEMAPVLDMVKGFAANEEGGIPTYPDYKFEVIEKVINGDKAKITYMNPEGKEETMDLIKQDGSWKVHMEK